MVRVSGYVEDEQEDPNDSLVQWTDNVWAHTLRTMRVIFSAEQNRHLFKRLFPPAIYGSFIDIGHFPRGAGVFVALVSGGQRDALLEPFCSALAAHQTHAPPSTHPHTQCRDFYELHRASNRKSRNERDYGRISTAHFDIQRMEVALEDINFWRADRPGSVDREVHGYSVQEIIGQGAFGRCPGREGGGRVSFRVLALL